MSRTGTDNSLLLNFRIINQTLISEKDISKGPAGPLPVLPGQEGGRGGSDPPRPSSPLPPQNGA